MSRERPRRRNDLVDRNLGEETIVYDAEGRTVHVLNVTGQVIWSLCDGEHDMSDMVDALRATFVIDEDTDLETHVAETLKRLRDMGLVA